MQQTLEAAQQKLRDDAAKYNDAVDRLVQRQNELSILEAELSAKAAEITRRQEQLLLSEKVLSSRRGLLWITFPLACGVILCLADVSCEQNQVRRGAGCDHQQPGRAREACGSTDGRAHGKVLRGGPGATTGAASVQGGFGL